MLPRKLVVGALLLGSVFASPASQAAILYTNGPLDGTDFGWTINFGFAVADSFILAGPSTVTGADYVTWMFPGDTTTSVDWAILNGSPGAGGVVLASGTAVPTDTFLFNNLQGYDIYSETIALPATNLAAGTYWFELQNAVNVAGDPEYWDVNGGPSSAWESADGDITTCSDGPGRRCSTTFDITGTAGAVPEPATLTLFGAGLAGLGALRRRKAKA